MWRSEWNFAHCSVSGKGKKNNTKLFNVCITGLELLISVSHSCTHKHTHTLHMGINSPASHCTILRLDMNKIERGLIQSTTDRHVHMYTNTHAHTCTQACTHKHMHAHAHIHTHTNTCTHTHTHKHTHHLQNNDKTKQKTGIRSVSPVNTQESSNTLGSKQPKKKDMDRIHLFMSCLLCFCHKTLLGTCIQPTVQATKDTSPKPWRVTTNTQHPLAAFTIETEDANFQDSFLWCGIQPTVEATKDKTL